MRRRDFMTLLGATAASPLAALNVRGQPAGRTYRLGVLVQAPRSASHWMTFFDELRKEGFIEGVNLSVVDAFSTPIESAETAVAVMVNARPDAIMTAGAFTRVLQGATQTIPILTVSDDLLVHRCPVRAATSRASAFWRRSLTESAWRCFWKRFLTPAG
jgi:putative ABC transport system substrate-binding protein